MNLPEKYCLKRNSESIVLTHLQPVYAPQRPGEAGSATPFGGPPGYPDIRYYLEGVIE